MRAEMGKDPSRAPPSQLNLPPGFRFYPTDEELVVHYLCKKAALEPFAIPIIAEIELYKFDPWDLPDKALFGEKEWYFFSPRDRKYPNGSRPNRAAGTGYWKATGTDKPIHTMSGSKKVGVKKALVFYRGKAPKGMKTNWIMHEYRLADGAAKSAKRKGSLRLDDWVLCRIYKKCSTSTQKAAIAKEQSESSCLDSVLSPGGMAGGCDNMNRLQQSPNGLESIHEGVYVDDKRTVSLHDLYQNGPTSSQGAASFYTPTYNNSYMQQLQGRIFDQAMANQAVPQKQGGGGLTTNHEQQGRAAASVGDVSSPDSPPSNMYSSRHTSEGSMLHEQQDHVDDAAESTFNNATLNLYNMQQPALNIQCADADQQQQQQQQQLNGTFPQSLLYMNGGGLDAGGLLPSPTASSFLGPHSTFSTLLDEPYSSSFFPSSSTSSSDPLYNHMRPFSRGPHLPWDAPHINKPHFST